jgi:hypothetical protein
MRFVVDLPKDLIKALVFRHFELRFGEQDDLVAVMAVPDDDRIFRFWYADARRRWLSVRAACCAIAPMRRCAEHLRLQMAILRFPAGILREG